VPGGDAGDARRHCRVGEHAVEATGRAVEDVRITLGIEARRLVGEAFRRERRGRILAGVGVEIAHQQRVGDAALACDRPREARQRARLQEPAMVPAALQVAAIGLRAPGGVATA